MKLFLQYKNIVRICHNLIKAFIGGYTEEILNDLKSNQGVFNNQIIFLIDYQVPCAIQSSKVHVRK